MASSLVTAKYSILFIAYLCFQLAIISNDSITNTTKIKMQDNLTAKVAFQKITQVIVIIHNLSGTIIFNIRWLTSLRLKYQPIGGADKGAVVLCPNVALSFLFVRQEKIAPELRKNVYFSNIDSPKCCEAMKLKEQKRQEVCNMSSNNIRII